MVGVWEGVQEKINRLREFDRRFQIFGSSEHRYRQHAPATDAAIARCEERLGVALPAELRALYQTIGDGDLGPHYGMTRLDDIKGYSPSKPLQTLVSLYEQVKEDGFYAADVNNFEIYHDRVHGLIAIIEEGCGHQLCMVTAGEHVGKLVGFSNDGQLTHPETNQQAPTRGPLRDLWDVWLDPALARFEMVQAMVSGTATARDINEALLARFDTYDNGQLFASLANLEYPSGSWNKCHAWYQAALAGHRATITSGRPVSELAKKKV